MGGFVKGGKIIYSNIGNSYEEMFKIGGVRDTNTGLQNCRILYGSSLHRNNHR